MQSLGFVVKHAAVQLPIATVLAYSLVPLAIYVVIFVARKRADADVAFDRLAALTLLTCGLSPAFWCLSFVAYLHCTSGMLETIVDDMAIQRTYAVICSYDPARRNSTDLDFAQNFLHRSDIWWTSRDTTFSPQPLREGKQISCDRVPVMHNPEALDIQAGFRTLSMAFLVAAKLTSAVGLWFLILLATRSLRPAGRRTPPHSR